jgi:hypothetical protein
MVWTAPRTWVEGETLSADLLNAQIRDNFLHQAANFAVGERGYFVSTGINQVERRRTRRVTLNEVATTSSTSYADDADSPGPEITLTTGTSCLVMWACTQHLTEDGGGAASTFTSVAVSGATTIAADTSWALRKQDVEGQRFAAAQFARFAQLTPGENTFKMRYAVGSASAVGVFFRRRLMVMPLN